MTRRGWTDILWSDLVGRCDYVRVDSDQASDGVRLPTTLTRAGFGAPGIDAGDVRLMPDWSTLRDHPWDPEAQIVIGNLTDLDGRRDPGCSRSALRAVVASAKTNGLDISAAAELEFYLIDPATGGPLYDEINQYSITKGAELEDILLEFRERLRVMDVPIEAVNPEYAGGQVEVNIAHTTAMDAADRTVLARFFVRELARTKSLDATFMAKPWTGQAGSGMHVHQSLWQRSSESGSAPSNLMYDDGKLSTQGQSYVAGLLTHMREMAAFGSMTPNAYHRRADYSFAPTRICWGADNRTLAVRAITGSPGATRVEQRDAAADCNVYLTLAGQFAAGLRGLAELAKVPEPVTGNAYTRTDLPVLPESFAEAVDLLAGSDLARQMLGPTVRAFLDVLEPERDVARLSSADWERDRYLSP